MPIDLVNRMQTSCTGHSGNINSLDKPQPETCIGYSTDNLSSYLLSIDVKENN